VLSVLDKLSPGIEQAARIQDHVRMQGCVRLLIIVALLSYCCAKKPKRPKINRSRGNGGSECITDICTSPALLNGASSVTTDNNGCITATSVITIVCDRGYEVRGANSRTCESTGNWNDTIPICVDVNSE